MKPNNNIYLQTEKLSVGYNKKALIRDINISAQKGQIITLIGPNGSGKSTILKSLTKQLSTVSGVVCIEKNNIKAMTNKDIAKSLSVVLTERVMPELMTCYDVVASGRYPYTNNFGVLSANDKMIIKDSLEKVHAIDIKDQDFSTLSDGQRQRVMLARAICQQPEIIVLDEPTSFLDIRHKIELLNILSEMAKEKNISVIMSLHEIDLAYKISDIVICVKGDKIKYCGAPEVIFSSELINDLYDIEKGSYNMLFGSVELANTEGEPRVFVVAGSGSGIPYYRGLQKRKIPFSTGILYENDVDYQVAAALGTKVFSNKAFEPVQDDLLEQVYKSLSGVEYIIDTGCQIGTYNTFNTSILEFAKSRGIPVTKNIT